MHLSCHDDDGGKRISTIRLIVNVLNFEIDRAAKFRTHLQRLGVPLYEAKFEDSAPNC